MPLVHIRFGAGYEFRRERVGGGASGRIDHSQKRTEVTSIGRAETAREASSGRGLVSCLSVIAECAKRSLEGRQVQTFLPPPIKATPLVFIFLKAF